MPYKDKEQQRAFQRQWIAQRRKDFFESKTCGCGSTDRLELDHIDPTQKVSHKIWSWSATRRDAELAKCQVLCYTCHRIKTQEMLKTGTHGLTMYKNWGCRCEICKTAKSVENARRYN